LPSGEIFGSLMRAIRSIASTSNALRDVCAVTQGAKQNVTPKTNRGATPQMRIFSIVSAAPARRAAFSP
jgi:hypothetical protein